MESLTFILMPVSAFAMRMISLLVNVGIFALPAFLVYALYVEHKRKKGIFLNQHVSGEHQSALLIPPDVVSGRGFLASFFSGPVLLLIGVLIMRLFPNMHVDFLMVIFFVVETMIAWIILGGKNIFTAIVKSDIRTEFGRAPSGFQSASYAIIIWFFLATAVPIGAIILTSPVLVFLGIL